MRHFTHTDLRPMAFTLLAACGTLYAQGRPAPRRATQPQPAARLAESAPINDLFRRAAEAQQRQDWKLAIDSLQRIIESPHAALVAVENGRYESTRKLAQRRLKDLPDAARSAYDLLYGSQARRLYEEAIEQHHFAKMHRVVDRYLLTPWGDEAVCTLAGWYVDLHKPGSALALLGELEDLSSPLKTQALGLAAVAYGQLHWPHEARERLQTLQAEGLNEALQSWFTQIDRFTAAASSAGTALEPPSAWRVSYGDWGRHGHMPATTPVLGGLPWRYELPTELSIPWQEVLEQQMRTQRSLTWQLIADGHRLFAKVNDQIIALDIDTLDALWVTDRPIRRVAPSRRSRRRQPQFNRRPGQDVSPRELDRALYDDRGAEISIAHGMIYSLDRDTSTNPLAALNPQQTPQGNLLVARDISRQGKTAWTRGGNEDQDPLANVVFAAAPIEVQEHLWVPYWKEKDLFLARLEPADGELTHSLHLCSVAGKVTNTTLSLTPAADEHILYVPTQAGLLVACDTRTATLKWASEYARATKVGSNREQPAQGWLACPPSIAGPLVILAPSDSDSLLAFDRATGKMVFSMPRGTHTHIIASGGQDLWLGGPTISRVNLTTAELVWQTDIGATAGRCILSGSHIMAPTLHDLVSLDAQTGQIIERQVLPGDQAPLGQLLCWGGALFSLDTEQIRKFPDLEQSYEPARRAHLQDPADARAAIRLGWLELLKQSPQRALQVLETLQPNDPQDAQRISEQAAHLKVLVLIALAEVAGTEPSLKQGYLRGAVETALTPPDRIHAVMTLADHLADQHDLPAAYAQLWQVSANVDLGFLVTHSPFHKQTARSALVDRLQALRKKLTPEQTQALAQQLHPDVLSSKKPPNAKAGEFERRLDALAQGDALEAWNQLAALRLGQRSRAKRQYEKAEYYLQQTIRLSLDAGATAEALCELASMYLGKELLLPQFAAPCIKRLTSDFSPETLSKLEASFTPSDLEDKLRSISRDRAARFSLSQDDETPLKLHSLGEGRLVDVAYNADQPEADVILTLLGPNELRAHHASDGTLAWQTELRLLSEPSREARVGTGLMGRNQPDPILQARRAGQTVLINTETGFHAVGLVTGRRLWSIPLEVGESSTSRAGNIALFDADAKVVAIRTAAHQIELRRTVDGSPLWQSRYPSHELAAVSLTGTRVVAIGRGGSTAVVLERSSGETVFEKSFAALDGSGRFWPRIILFAEQLCGFEDQTHLSAVRLLDGSVAWQVELPFAANILLKASPSHLVAGGPIGEIAVLDATDGHIVYHERLAFGRRGLLAGHLQDETLWLAGRTPRLNEKEVEFAAIDLTTERLLWTCPDANIMTFNPNCLGLLNDRIPMIYLEHIRPHPAHPGQIPADAPAFLVFIDKNTGQFIGEPLPLPREEGQTKLTGQLQFWPHRVVVATNAAAKLLVLEPVSSE